jgi:hypothetical protein
MIFLIIIFFFRIRAIDVVKIFLSLFGKDEKGAVEIRECRTKGEQLFGVAG